MAEEEKFEEADEGLSLSALYEEFEAATRAMDEERPLPFVSWPASASGQVEAYYEVIDPLVDRIMAVRARNEEEVRIKARVAAWHMPGPSTDDFTHRHWMVMQSLVGELLDQPNYGGEGPYSGDGGTMALTAA
ncbi:hypothetical protein [Brevundimonas sp.]|uniref:hypothetical protein n=1 Tax=Brevundimonas sp. TaxID=1871086 RepID=UPI0025F70BC7|nr:hypothetical protein [Brevundimonas sp.]